MSGIVYCRIEIFFHTHLNKPQQIQWHKLIYVTVIVYISILIYHKENMAIIFGKERFNIMKWFNGWVEYI